MGTRKIRLNGGPLDGQIMKVVYLQGKGWPEYMQFNHKGAGKSLIYRLKGEVQGYHFERYEYEDVVGRFMVSQASTVMAQPVPQEELEPDESGLLTTGGDCRSCKRAVKWPFGDPPPAQCPHCGYMDLSFQGIIAPAERL